MDQLKLVQIINESSLISTSKTVVRDYETILQTTLCNAKPLKIITGLRRSGKSFLLKRLYQHLLSQGIPRENILFVNFEHDQLPGELNSETLRQIFQTFQSMNNTDKPTFAFLDEIQNVENWHKYIRTIYDAKDINIYLTGSNSKLLSGEIATVLGGRVLEFQIQPFNFAELLKYYGIDLSAMDLFALDSKRSQISKIANQYLEYGAIPETLELVDNLKMNYKGSLIEKIIVNDITKRHSISAPNIILQLCSYLERSLSGIVSATNLSRNVSVSDVTVKKYLDYISQTLLIHPLQKYHFQARQMLDTQSKYYFIDNLFCRNASQGARLENLVFCELVRTFEKNKLFFARNDTGKEVDFVLLDNDSKIEKAFQISFDIDDRNYSREISSLKLLSKYQRKKIDKYLIFANNLVKNVSPDNDIKHVNFIDWLIGKYCPQEL